MENKIINYISQTPENTNPSVLATLLGELKTPKPLTYDYMPAGYPSKTMETTTLIDYPEAPFEPATSGTSHRVTLPNPFEIVAGKTYTVNWDGIGYECIGVALPRNMYIIGNLSIMGGGDDTGEPFLYAYESAIPRGQFITLDTVASHAISVKTTEETVIPMAEEFLPNTTTGGVTTLHINVTAVNRETMTATFTADKTPAEMAQAAATGPVWCVVTFAAGIMDDSAVSMGVPPAWLGGEVAFGVRTAIVHKDDGSNKIVYAVREGFSDSWNLHLDAFAF